MRKSSEQITGVKSVPSKGQIILSTETGKQLWIKADKYVRGAKRVNLIINEPNDTFVATEDSKTMGAEGKPLFLKGDTVVRQKESYQIDSYDTLGEMSPVELALAILAKEPNAKIAIS